MVTFSDIYGLLVDNYGAQGWWPVTPEGMVYPEYSGGPKNQKQIFEVMFGAILAQNTSWKNVEKAISELNKKTLFDVDKILAISQDELAQVIRSSGYYNQKARKLKYLCSFLKENPLNELNKCSLGILKEKLLAVSGIGKETADSIMLYSLGMPIFIIDAYSVRIFSRIGLCSKKVTYDGLQCMIEQNLDKDAQVFNEYHALLVEHAKRYCRKKPECETCILKSVCKKKI